MVKRKYVLVILAFVMVIGLIFVIRLVNYYNTYPFETHVSLTRYNETRRLIVTADDFGAMNCIDAGTLIGVKLGIVNTLTAMTNFEHVREKIVNAKKSYPKVAIGIHLNITSGRPVLSPSEIPTLVNENGEFYAIEDILSRLKSVSIIELEKELWAQVEVFKETNVNIDHLSYQHNLLALYPPFFEIVISMAKELGVPLRNPMPISVENKELFGDAGTQVKAKQLGFSFFFKHPIDAITMLKFANKKTIEESVLKLKKKGIATPDHMIDYFYGNTDSKSIFKVLNNLPNGDSELIFHLGTDCGDELVPNGIDGNYLPIREQELVIATSEYIKQYLKENNIELISYQDLK